MVVAEEVQQAVDQEVRRVVGEAEAEAMEALETNVLASMGVPNPYSREERPSGASPG